MDKQFFRAIAANQFAVPEGHTPQELLPQLMEGLGSLDSEFRDNLCGEILWTWIVNGHYTTDEVRGIARRMMTNLREGIGAVEGDRVFLRTFSVLILHGIVLKDADKQFLARQELDEIFAAAIQYLADEQDLRGYVPEKGWAHSAAHTAELLNSLAQHPALGAAELEQLLAAITRKVAAPTLYPFLYNEENRLGVAVRSILKRDLVPVERVAACFKSLAGDGERFNFREFNPERDFALYHNKRCFLYCMHILLAHPDMPAQAQAELPGVVYAATKWFIPWCLGR